MLFEMDKKNNGIDIQKWKNARFKKKSTTVTNFSILNQKLTSVKNQF